METLNCMNCGKDFEGDSPKMCCSGRDCGCMGMPIEPVVCSKECYDKITKPPKDSKSAEEILSDVTGIPVYRMNDDKGEYVTKSGAIQAINIALKQAASQFTAKEIEWPSDEEIEQMYPTKGFVEAELGKSYWDILSVNEQKVTAAKWMLALLKQRLTEK